MSKPIDLSNMVDAETRNEGLVEIKKMINGLDAVGLEELEKWMNERMRIQ